MSSRARDTSATVAQLQLDLLRAATPEQRLRIAVGLSQTAWALSWSGFCRRYAELPEIERRSRFLALLYPDLPERVRDGVRRRWQQRLVA